ncbi:neuroendocrine secretory protein 55 [Tupaia chinensis]|uniref:neuroendocrine secretory protein 55 n=1 Tax=Tupaia chinensis TaxID=246437 RepID=UPI0003C8CEDA|nr:neuroendocrine secretory protein 55 [Tupaia chinensis]
MDRRSRAQQWRRARHNYNDLCPPIGRRAATALLWLSCSIALLRALATSNARAQQRAAAQQRRSFLNAHHRSGAQVFPEPPESESDHEHEHEHEEADLELSLPECLEYQESFDYETETETESEIESETDFETDPEPETAPTTEPETEPEEERGPVAPKNPHSGQSLAQRLHALKLQSPHTSPSRAQPGIHERRGPRQGEEPEPKDKDPRDPEESEEPREEKQQRRCKPKKPTRRDPSPEQRAAAQQRRSFLNAHHRSGAQVFPEPPESESDHEHEHEHEEADLELSLPECLEYQESFDYETETETESEIESETDFETDPEPETAPTTEPETEPEEERGPVAPKNPHSGQSLAQRLHALKLQSPHTSPSRAQPGIHERRGPRQGEEPEPKDKDPRDPEESEEPREEKQQRRCKPKKPTRRDPSPESPSKRGPIPIRRH